jgi:D-3-phosphoglycerate dehydrogenase / 2-oxoglutarate reductase
MNKKPLKECKILVTPTSFAKYDKSLAKYLEERVDSVEYNNTGKPMVEEDLIPIIGDFDGMIAGLDNITEKVIEKAKNLKIIARYGVGTNNVNLDAAKRKGIFVTNTPGANSISVAELTIGLAIAAARSIPYVNIETKKGGWPRLKGISLQGKVFGLVGLGSIAKEVVFRLKAFNCELITYHPHRNCKFEEENNIKYSSLDGLLTLSDFVSLHIPVTKNTSKIVNKNFLEKMKKGSILINTSRGELIDEEALYESIKKGNIKAAALDSFSKEPPERNNPLFSLPQVIVTPHIGAATDMAANEMGKMSMEDCIAVLKGEKPKYIVIDPTEKNG